MKGGAAMTRRSWPDRSERKNPNLFLSSLELKIPPTFLSILWYKFKKSRLRMKKPGKKILKENLKNNFRDDSIRDFIDIIIISEGDQLRDSISFERKEWNTLVSITRDGCNVVEKHSHTLVSGKGVRMRTSEAQCAESNGGPTKEGSDNDILELMIPSTN